MEPKPVPTIDDLRPGVLKVLEGGDAKPVKELHRKVADSMGLSEEVRSQEIPSGQLRYANRINWACSALVHAGLLERPKRGWYQITEQGREVASRHLATYSEQDMMEWPTWRAYQKEIAQRKASSANVASGPLTPADPVEVIEEAARTLNAEVETTLRNGSKPPHRSFSRRP